MPDLQPPSGTELRACHREENDDFELVHEDTYPDDHGYGYSKVFKRKADETYWEVYGLNQGGGGYDTLRDDPETITICRVFPRQQTITEYVTEKVASAISSYNPFARPVAI